MMKLRDVVAIKIMADAGMMPTVDTTIPWIYWQFVIMGHDSTQRSIVLRPPTPVVSRDRAVEHNVLVDSALSDVGNVHSI